MNNLFDMTKKELQTFLVAQGMKKFRADQIFHYVYKENIFSWDEMVLLPKKDRQLLKDVLPIHFPEIVSRLDAPDGQTVKLLLQLADGETVETVLMMHDYGRSAVPSTAPSARRPRTALSATCRPVKWSPSSWLSVNTSRRNCTPSSSWGRGNRSSIMTTSSVS